MDKWMDAEDRYFHDPTFHALVDSMVDAIINLRLTPSELRDAAMYAAIRFEIYRKEVKE
jgi:hypothetical protein